MRAPSSPSAVGTIAPAITARGLTKRYGDFTAVDDVDLNIEPGQIYALLGLNGAGKTTLIRMLLGMIRPTGGDMNVLGSPVHPDATDLWARVGYLVETPAAYPELTVAENLDLVRRLRRITDRASVTDIMDRLQLTGYANRQARHLSLGNAQRLGLAKALIHRPRLLILDEPANGLDPAGVVDIRTLLHDLAERDGVTVLLSSHLLTEVAHLATRVGVLHHGRLLQQIDTADLPAHLRRRLLITTRDNDAAQHALLRAGHDVAKSSDGMLVLTSAATVERPDGIATELVHAGHPPTQLTVEAEDLETYFLRLINPIAEVME